jgi:hypothetical protein
MIGDDWFYQVLPGTAFHDDTVPAEFFGEYLFSQYDEHAQTGSHFCQNEGK